MIVYICIFFVTLMFIFSSLDVKKEKVTNIYFISQPQQSKENEDEDKLRKLLTDSIIVMENALKDLNKKKK